MQYPYPSQKKQENLEYGRSVVESFCALNDMPSPKIKLVSRTRDYGFSINIVRTKGELASLR